MFLRKVASLRSFSMLFLYINFKFAKNSKNNTHNKSEFKKRLWNTFAFCV